MVQRVYEQASSCQDIDEVIVATDDSNIASHVALFGGKALLTGTYHKSGTERCGEVCQKLQREGIEFDMIVNIQGDEPYIHPEQIGQVVSCFGAEGTMIASLMKKIVSSQELHCPNVVKVVTDAGGRAMYFSRAAIPYVRDADSGQWTEKFTFYKHIGIYGFRPDILLQLVKLPPSAAETAESLEQLRWLDRGFNIQMKETSFESIAVDEPSDLLKFTNRD